MNPLIGYSCESSNTPIPVKKVEKLKNKIMEKYQILKIRDGKFQGDGGESIAYFWVKAKRISDGVTIEFGTREGRHRASEEIVELDIEKYEATGGRFRYKEILSED